MTTIFCVILLACSVLWSGCRNEEKESRMIKIEKLALTEKTLTLDFQVSNPFTYEIWICEDIDVRGKYEVETRIDAGTVWIRLRGYLESNVTMYVPVVCKYRRLLPGEPYLGRILLNLPIRNASPVYEFGEDHKRRKQIDCPLLFEIRPGLPYTHATPESFFDRTRDRAVPGSIESCVA